MSNSSRERAWISKRVSLGQKPDKLYKGISLFLAKPKHIVMEQKDLSSYEYDRRYQFMSNCFKILHNDLKK